MMNMKSEFVSLLDNKMFVSFLASRWHCLCESPQWKVCCVRACGAACLRCHAPAPSVTVVYFYPPWHGGWTSRQWKPHFSSSPCFRLSLKVCLRKRLHICLENKDGVGAEPAGHYLQFRDCVPCWLFTRVCVTSHGAIFSRRELSSSVCLSWGGDLEKSSWKNRLSAERKI